MSTIPYAERSTPRVHPMLRKGVIVFAVLILVASAITYHVGALSWAYQRGRLDADSEREKAREAHRAYLKAHPEFAE